MGEVISDVEAENALQDLAGDVSGLASGMKAAPTKYLIMLVPAEVGVFSLY